MIMANGVLCTRQTFWEQEGEYYIYKKTGKKYYVDPYRYVKTIALALIDTYISRDRGKKMMLYSHSPKS